MDPTVRLRRERGVLEKDLAPYLTARQEQTVKLLASHKAPFRRYLECFLCLVGLSPYYPFDENSYPAFEYPDGTEMGLFYLIKTADPRKVQAVEVHKGVEQENVDPEDAYPELADPDESTTVARQSEEEVVIEQPKKVRKRRLVKQSDVLPAKRLRKDHPMPVSSTGGKTLSSGIEYAVSSRLPDREHTCSSLRFPLLLGKRRLFDSSAKRYLRICTTMESSSTLGIPVDTTDAAITSTRAAVTTNFATDVNPDLAGPSQPEESKGSDDSFYEPPTLDPSEAKRWSRAEHELELKEKLRAKYTARGRLLEEKDLEILTLKSQLAEKEAEAAEVIRLRDQVSSLSGEKSALTAEVSALNVTITQKDHDMSLLDSRATHLASTLDDAKVACAEARNKITSLASERDRLVSEVSSLRAGFQNFKEKMEVQQEKRAQELYNRVAELEAHVMDVFGRLEGEFYPTYLTVLTRKRWLLTHGIQLAFLKCLKSPEYQGILGHALGRAVDFGMQEGLEVGYKHGIAGRNLSAVDAYNPEVAKASYVNAVKSLEDASFPFVDLLKSKKDAGMDEVLDCFLLDEPLAGLSKAAYLQPCILQLSIPIHHVGDETVVGETSLSFALMNVYARAEGAKKHDVALRQLMMEIVSAPLYSQTWVGEASTSVVPLSIEDYDEEDTDKAMGSVVVVPKLETCHF
ncbi:hypothetical protein Tco_0662352 [Tanacetum coccineum]